MLKGRVKVGGRPVKLLSETFPRDAAVTVDGKSAKRAPRELYLFHKPRGVITTMSDPEGRRCIADFVGKLPARVFPVGRLDFDVCGLLLLTNDGDFADSLLHPRYEIEREYIARVHGIFEKSAALKLQKGFLFEGERMKALRAGRAQRDILTDALVGEPKAGESLVRVVVAEGSKHFVKRLLHAGGYPVIRLARVRFGKYEIGDLEPGELRRVAEFKLV